MAKDLMLNLRLDDMDRERLDVLVQHFCVPAATAIRMLIKERYDEIAMHHAGDLKVEARRSRRKKT